MKIGQDRIVTIGYQLTDEKGQVLDRSSEDAPLAYLHGRGNIIPGLERALEGHESGERVEVEVPPEEAYGAYDPELDLAVPLDAFPEEVRGQLEPGVRFQTQDPRQPGEERVFTVRELNDQQVHVTGNHPLAGVTLFFAIDVLEVREARPDELEHGHAH